MMPGIGRLIKMRHYGRFKALRVISFVQFYLTLVLTFLPLFFGYIVDIISSTFSITLHPHTIYSLYILSWTIAILSAINIIREYLLSNAEIVTVDYKRSIIRRLILLVMDTYGWSGSCRATLFVPRGDKIVIYDRISSGHGPGEYDEGKCFFRMGQGIPGKAWKYAWNGNGFLSLLESMQFGNVPDQTLNNRESLRKFFKDQFSIADNDIYESLGKQKFKIRSYMAVGILGQFRDLSCILVIDSEDEGTFADLEQIQMKRAGRMTHETGVFMAGEGDGPISDDFSLPLPEDVKKALRPKVKRLDSGDWKDTKETVKEWALVARMISSTEPNIPIRQFLFSLHWMLKQVREIFILN